MPITEFVWNDVVVRVEEYDDPTLDRELDIVTGLMRFLSDDDWITRLPDLLTLPSSIRLA